MPYYLDSYNIGSDKQVDSMSVVQGIRFFDDLQSCIESFDGQHWTKKVQCIAQSYGALVLFALDTFKLMTSPSQISQFEASGDNGFSKKRLVVCIHGLNGAPSQFESIVSELQKKELSETDIYIPTVLERGNAKLDETVKPIFDEIAKWVKTDGDKELVLVGVSNGGRIAKAIEAELAKLGSFGNVKKMRLISIVGATRGSVAANLANVVQFPWLMSKNIACEMPTDSERTVQLHMDWLAGHQSHPDIERDYTFIASPHDWMVPNYDSTLAEVNKYKARYALVPGHGHCSIVDAVAATVAELITG